MGNIFSCGNSDDKFQSHKYSCYMADYTKKNISINRSYKITKISSILKKDLLNQFFNMKNYHLLLYEIILVDWLFLLVL